MKAKLRGMRKQDAALDDDKFCGVAAAMIGSAIVGGAVSANSASKAAKAQGAANQANIDAAKMDPRLEEVLYGDGQQKLKTGVQPQFDENGKQVNQASDYEAPNNGLLGQYQALGQAPQDPRLQGFGNANLDYLGNASTDMGQVRDAAGGLLSGAGVPKVSATGQGPMAFATGAKVNAPGQNKMDLTSSYDRFINGNPAENPYLTGAIQGGIDQSQQAFTRMQGDATRNLTENILPSIRGGAVIAGGYGGSRQGIAEGRAIGDTTRELARATENFGNNNTAAAVGAQASAFDRGQDRSLAATQGLGAQQYGVAQQDAATKTAAEFMNVDRTNDIHADWARRADGAQVQNQGATMQGATIGAGLLSGQLAGAAGAGTNQDNYSLNRATQTNGLLQPYLLKNNNVPASQPVYSNTGGAALGGAMAGMSLYNQFRQPAATTGYVQADKNGYTPYG